MFQPLSSYQLYRYEQGLSTGERRAADVLAGEGAAALRDLRVRLGRSFRLGRRVLPARAAADATTVSARVLPSVR
jgi:hypothetical protein